MGIKDLRSRIKKGIVAIFILNFSFLILTGCSFKKEITPPANLIPSDTMELIITNLTITEAALSSGIPNDTIKKLNALADYKISPARFDSSFSYYSKNPQKLKEIYERVLEDLNKK